MFVTCYQLKNLAGHLVETEVLLNQLRLNMLTYFFVKMTIFITGDSQTKNKIRNDLWKLFWQSLPLFLVSIIFTNAY